MPKATSGAGWRDLKSPELEKAHHHKDVAAENHKKLTLRNLHLRIFVEFELSINLMLPCKDVGCVQPEQVLCWRLSSRPQKKQPKFMALSSRSTRCATQHIRQGTAMLVGYRSWVDIHRPWVS